MCPKENNNRKKPPNQQPPKGLKHSISKASGLKLCSLMSCVVEQKVNFEGLCTICADITSFTIFARTAFIQCVLQGWWNLSANAIMNKQTAFLSRRKTFKNFYLSHLEAPQISWCWSCQNVLQMNKLALDLFIDPVVKKQQKNTFLFTLALVFSVW